MLRANALYIVIVISLVIGVLCSSLILLAYYFRLSLLDFQLDQRLSANLNSATTLALATKSEEGTKVLDLYGEGRDSVSVETKSWGVFDLGIAKAFSGKKIKKTAFLAGYKPAGVINSALFLTDNHRPVSFTGRTVVKGTAYLPKAGVKRAYIGGRSFVGKELVSGNIKSSNSQLPTVNEKVLSQLNSYFNPASISNAKHVPFEDFDKIQQGNNSFSDSTLVLHSALPIRLNTGLSGKIVVHSDSYIEVSSSANLKDVILTAPYIRILSGVKGVFQAFARDSIHVSPNVKLDYPAAIGLAPSEASKITFIDIGPGVEIKGVVFVCSKVRSLQEPFLKISKGAEITGHVYSSGYVEISGSIYGHLSANKTYLTTGGGVYENHLMDAVIDQTKLPVKFIGSSLLPCENKKRIVKWLNY